MGVKLKIDQNLKISDTPILINIHQKNIKYVLESLRSRKACGIEEIPNDVLNFGGNCSIKFLCRFIYENYLL